MAIEAGSAVKHEFKQGDVAWTKDGRKVYVAALVLPKGYAVQQEIDADFSDPSYGPGATLGPYDLIEQLFRYPPAFIVSDEIAELEKCKESAMRALLRIQNDILNAERDRAKIIDKLKQVPALAYIEQFLDGKMGWIAITDYGCGYKVMPMADALKLEDRWRDKETKLLSLFGDAKGDFHWRLSTYHDGSGSKIELWPFETEEAAKAFCLQRLIHEVEEAFAQYLGDAKYASYLATRAKWLADAGGTVTAGAQEVIDRAKRQSLERERDDAAKYAAKYNDKVAGIDAALAKLP